MFAELKREDLIRMAMLVGSDYTLGLNGIGPVTALEILASFPSHNLFDGLEKFRDWFTGRCKTGLPRISLKKKIRNTVISPGKLSASNQKKSSFYTLSKTLAKL